MADEPQQPIVQMPQQMLQQYKQPMDTYSGAIIQLTDPQELLFAMELTFKGHKLDRDGNIIDTGDRLLNDKGINSIIGQIQSILNRVTVLSNVDSDIIEKFMLPLVDTIAQDLMVNKKTYEIKDSVTRTKISNIAQNTAHICLLRAKEEGERRFWGKIQQDVNINNNSNQKQKQGFMQNMLGWKG